MKRKLLFCFGLLLLIQVIQSQNGTEGPDTPRASLKANAAERHSPLHANEKIIFQSIPPNFEYNGIRAILQDHKGYLWFGSADGLIRYDGSTIYSYENIPGDSTSLSNSSINALAEDEKGNLWIGTSSGLNLYNRAMDNFIHIGSTHQNLARLITNYISELTLDRNSHLWVGTYGDGVHIYDTENQTLIHYAANRDEPNTIHSNRITSIAIDKDNNAWIGSLEGLNYYMDKTKEFRHFSNEEGNPESLSSNNITFLTIDTAGILWVGTRGEGLNKLIQHKHDVIFKRYRNGPGPNSLSNNFILSLSADPRGFLWIGTENGGLNRLSLADDHIDIFQVEEGNKFSLISNSIWSLYYDREGKLWIGTATKGISVIDEKFSKFEPYQKNIVDSTSLTDNDVTGFSEDSEGNVWIATDGGGICKFDTKKRQIVKAIYNSDGYNPLVNNAVQAILCDVEDNIWIGTWAGGIDRLTKSGKKIRNYEMKSEEGGGNNNLLTLYEDARGVIWAGTAGSGLFQYNKAEDNFRQVVCENPANVLNSSSYITSILQDNAGRYWIGSLNGLVSMSYTEEGDAECFNFFPTDQVNGLTSRFILILFLDSKGRIWIGTGDYGLFLFDDEDDSFRTINRQDGLPANSIKGILEDDEGNLWITTSKGLCRFNYDSLSFTNYYREDGLNSNEFYHHSCLKTKRGEFFLGGENGFNTFYPHQITKNSFIPPVYLTDLKIDNASAEIGAKNSPLIKHISETSGIELNHRQSSFTIEFIALNYTQSASNQYTYKLDGLDENWIEAGNRRSASYTNIRPGRYIFMVKGSNNDGVWNNIPTTLSIRLKPPLWKTWWAILSYLIMISALIVISLMIWNERIHIKHQLKMEQLGREKEHELNEANIQFFTNISHEFRTPLSLIMVPLEGLILSAQSKIKEQLLVIYRNAQRLLYLTNNLMDFRKLEEGRIRLQVKHGEIIGFLGEISSYFNLNFKRRQINFSIVADDEAIHGWFDPEKLETVLLNLLSNATKFTEDGGTIKIVATLLSPADTKEKYGLWMEKDPSPSRYLQIEVIDSGSGISPEDITFIFEKFYQTTDDRKQKSKGTGIGLALTKGLVELSHGFIQVRSIPRQETCFWFILPIDRTAFKEDEIVNIPTSVVSRIIIPKEEGATPKGPKNKPIQEAPTEERAEILIVEDKEELRNYLAKELGDKYSVHQAEDGHPGIELAFQHVPDLIVCDIVMPDCSGIELCNVLKADVRTSHIPIILLTAKTNLSDQIEGVKTGADAYVTKPFNLQFLEAKIDQLIHSRRKLYAHFSQDVYMIPNKMAENELDQQFLNKAIDFIISNIADNTLSVESLSVELNLSRSNVYRKIKALTGKTIIEFIRIIRLKQALKLMESKKYSLAEVAYLTGFTSPSYFTKSFKDQYGKPPSGYMNR